MAKRGKKYQEALKLVDRQKRYTLTEAVDLVKKTNIAKFDATVEVAFKLNIDPRKAEQNLRGAVSLPNGTTPDMMGELGKLGRVLGPKGLMPNPKTGTVTMNIEQTVKEFKAGKVEYRTDKVGNIQVPVGKVSFTNDKLVENVQAIYRQIMRIKPQTVKGVYVQNLTITSTMGPGIKISTEVVE